MEGETEGEATEEEAAVCMRVRVHVLIFHFSSVIITAVTVPCEETRRIMPARECYTHTHTHTHQPSPLLLYPS